MTANAFVAVSDRTAASRSTKKGLAIELSAQADAALEVFSHLYGFL
jgi:hypothetical protein